MLRVIGKGSFAKVILVKKKDTNQLFAMKVLSKPRVVKRKQVEHTKTERRVLEMVGCYSSHPYISRLHYAFQTDDKLYLILEYCAGGELFFHLSKLKKFPQHWTKVYCAELVLALNHLHRNNIAYRDLKPENILLDVDGHVKLADFGLSKDEVTEPTTGASSLCGTPEYLAPEVLDRRGHGTAVDWWGLGMVTYEMLTGLPPWYTTDRKKLFTRLRCAELRFPDYMSPEARSLISGLLQRDPSARLGGDGKIDKIKDHQFFGTLDWEALMLREVKAPFKPAINTKYLNGSATPSSEAENSAAMALNFNGDYSRLPFESAQGNEGQGGGAVGQVNGSMFNGFTFDEEKGSPLKGAADSLRSLDLSGSSPTGFVKDMATGSVKSVNLGPSGGVAAVSLDTTQPADAPAAPNASPPNEIEEPLAPKPADLPPSLEASPPVRIKTDSG
jgi:serum/glucocorticoid-regulated kinase 2